MAISDQIKDATFEQPLRPTSRTALQTILKKSDDGDQPKTIEVFSAPVGNSTWTRNFNSGGLL